MAGTLGSPRNLLPSPYLCSFAASCRTIPSSLNDSDIRFTKPKDPRIPSPHDQMFRTQPAIKSPPVTKFCFQSCNLSTVTQVNHFAAAFRFVGIIGVLRFNFGIEPQSVISVISASNIKTLLDVDEIPSHGIGNSCPVESALNATNRLHLFFLRASSTTTASKIAMEVLT